MNRISLPLVLIILVVATDIASSQPQDPNASQRRVIGEVTAINPTDGRIMIKADSGGTVAITVDAKSAFSRVPPGEDSLEKAIKIELNEVNVGDRVYARGRASNENQTAQGEQSIIGQQIIVMSKTDIQKRNEKEREDWRTRSIAGVVVTLNPASREFVLQRRGPEGVSRITVTAADDKEILRYAPDSVSFSDAKFSSFREIAVGDQVRALGQKSSDGTRFTAEKIVSGSFRTLGGIITEVNSDGSEVKMNIFGAKDTVIVALKKGSKLRKIVPQVLPIMVQMSLGGGSVVIPQQQPAPPPAGSKPASGQAGAAGTAKPGGIRLELQDLIDRLSPADKAELKPGSVIAVSGTASADRSRLTAITILTGVDLLINAMQQPGGRSQPVVMGLPPGFSEIGIGRP